MPPISWPTRCSSSGAGSTRCPTTRSPGATALPGTASPTNDAARRAGCRLVERAGANADPDAGAGLDPQHGVETSDPELIAAIDTLTDSEAEIVRLWAWEQLEPRQIATVLETTANAVSVALARAKRKLAERLARQDPTGAGHIQGASNNDWKGDE